jgi:hypothetical protein
MSNATDQAAAEERLYKVQEYLALVEAEKKANEKRGFLAMIFNFIFPDEITRARQSLSMELFPLRPFNSLAEQPKDIIWLDMQAAAKAKSSKPLVFGQ